MSQNQNHSQIINSNMQQYDQLKHNLLNTQNYNKPPINNNNINSNINRYHNNNINNNKNNSQNISPNNYITNPKKSQQYIPDVYFTHNPGNPNNLNPNVLFSYPSAQYQSSQYHNAQNISNTNQNLNILQFSKGSRASNLHEEQRNGYEKLSQLSERLKNVHHFYKLRIDEEKLKNAERNQVFMGIIQELQNAHNLKVISIQQQIQAAEEQRKQVQQVDDKMSLIKGSIDQILQQSTLYKTNNEKMQNQITLKQQKIRQKQRQCQKLKRQVFEFRNQRQEYARRNLKENKRQKEMLQMIEHVINSLGSQNYQHYG